MIDPWLWRYDRVIASEPLVARQISMRCLQLEAQRWRQRIFAVHLAMEEALVNAIHHGNVRRVEKRPRGFACRRDRVPSNHGRGRD